MTISGAYGRDYKSKKAALVDFNADKDFRVRDVFSGGGTYVNRADLVGGGVSTITLRYKRDAQVAVITRKSTGVWA